MPSYSPAKLRRVCHDAPPSLVWTRSGAGRAMAAQIGDAGCEADCNHRDRGRRHELRGYGRAGSVTWLLSHDADDAVLEPDGRAFGVALVQVAVKTVFKRFLIDHGLTPVEGMQERVRGVSGQCPAGNPSARHTRRESSHRDSAAGSPPADAGTIVD